MIGRELRRYLVCLGLALSFALLPTVLVHHTGSSSCDSVLQTQDTTQKGVTGNPFSHYNLCKIRQRLSNLTRDVYQHPIRGGLGANHQEDQVVVQQPGAPPPTPHAPVPTRVSPPVAKKQEQVASPSPPAQKDGGKQPAASVPAAAKPEPAAGGVAQEADFAAYNIEDLITTKIRVDMHNTAEDWSDFQLPKTQDDIDRIMKLPHIDECYFCQVCVPNAAMQLNNRRASRMLHEADSQLVYGIQPLEQDSSSDTSFETLADDPEGGFDIGTADSKLEAGSSWAAAVADGGHAASMAHASTGRQQQRQQPVDQGGRRLQQAVTAQPKQGAGAKKKKKARAPPPPKYEARDETESDGILKIEGKTFDISDIAPGERIFKAKQTKPNCTICRGCDHTLEMMASGSVLLGSYYAHEPGGSPSWLFRVRSDKTSSGWAVVKTWCIPVLKVKQRGLAMCSPKKVYAQVKLLLAQQKLTAQCGLNEIVPKVWVEPVNGVIPGKGFHINWLGLWADIADGVSVQNIQEFGKPQMAPATMLDLFTNKVNHDEIKLGAIFDLLFSQCDRHQQNVFLTETGKVWLIDNDQVFSTAWRKCGIDSMVVPTTQKFMINHLGFFYVLKYPHADPPKDPATVVNPLLLLDYRCHVKGGEIGKDFPPQLVKCMKHISAKDPETIQAEYGYPNLRMAEAVRNRTHDLLAYGYEWTLLWGQPTNQPMHRYKIAPKCCSMLHNQSAHRYQCLDPSWYFMRDIPYGNAWHGGPWHGTPGKDTGTYEGGTIF